MAAFEGGTPRREDLDRIVPDRPVFLTNRDGHGAWVNSKALEMAGVTADTPDPSDGRIERDEDGSPSGTLHEGAMDLVTRLLPDDTPAELEEALRLGQRHLHGFGITAWQDAIVEPHAGSAPMSRSRTAASSRLGSSGRCGGTTIEEPTRSTSSSSAVGPRRSVATRRRASN
jgi:predicted amidohydrolase YtcJ